LARRNRRPSRAAFGRRFAARPSSATGLAAPRWASASSSRSNATALPKRSRCASGLQAKALPIARAGAGDLSDASGSAVGGSRHDAFRAPWDMAARFGSSLSWPLWNSRAEGRPRRRRASRARFAVGGTMSPPRDDRQNDLFRPPLAEIINLRHLLVRLAKEIDWGFLAGRFRSVCRIGASRAAASTSVRLNRAPWV
jgi:hypothetical protein